jgi:hypothetical protein
LTPLDMNQTGILMVFKSTKLVMVASSLWRLSLFAPFTVTGFSKIYSPIKETD